MKQLRVGIDIDGVLADFITPYIAEMNRIQGSNIVVAKSAIDEWHFETKVGFTGKTREAFWTQAQKDEAFWFNLPSLFTQEDYEALFRLVYTHKADVFYVTKCPLNMRKIREDWIMKQLLPRAPVIATNHKGHIAYGLELHAMIDDKPENLIDVRKHCGLVPECYLINQPWNAHSYYPYMKRVDSLAISLDKLMEKEYNG